MQLSLQTPLQLPRFAVFLSIPYNPQQTFNVLLPATPCLIQFFHIFGHITGLSFEVLRTLHGLQVSTGIIPAARGSVICSSIHVPRGE